MSTVTVTRSTARPERSALRFPAAVLLLSNAAVHLPLVREHLHEAPYIGVLFIALSVTATALAVILLVGDSTPAWAATFAISVATIAAYVVSRSVGLPQMPDDIGNWLEPLGIAALVVEAGAAGLAGWVLGQDTGPEDRKN